MKTGFHHSNESLGNEKSDMMEWQKANIAQNLRILVKDKLIITDDNNRYVSLPKQMFWEFLRELEHINSAFEDITEKKEVNFVQHLGSNYYVTLTSPYWIVHIRRWFFNDKNEHKPGQGVALKIQEWKALYRSLKSFDLSHIKDVIPCYVSHCNPLESLECNICTPHYVNHHSPLNSLECDFCTPKYGKENKNSSV